MNKELTYKDIVNIHQLKEHTEGGYYKTIYVSKSLIKKEYLGPGFHGDRPYMSTVVASLSCEELLRIHVNPCDEMFSYHLGDPLTLFFFDAQGKLSKINLGPDPSKGHVLSYHIAAGTYFGGVCDGDWTLYTCTASPGFHFTDFKPFTLKEALSIFPEEQGFIESLIKKFPSS